MASKRRIPKEAGFCRPSKLPKGPRGFNLCRECSHECARARKTFCSKACVHTWKCRTNPTYQRAQVVKRDKGICALCSHNCLKDAKKYKSLKLISCGVKRIPKTRNYTQATPQEIEAAKQEMARIREFHSAPAHRTSFWDMDHIKAVVEGGGECSLDNFRTLCIPCHLKVTKELAGRRAAARKED